MSTGLKAYIAGVVTVGAIALVVATLLYSPNEAIAIKLPFGGTDTQLSIAAGVGFWIVLTLVGDGFHWLFAKLFFFLFCFLWFRATFPRYRYDQIMRLGWKILIPITIVWIAVEGVMVYFKVGPWAVVS